MHHDGNEIPASWGKMAAAGTDAGQIAEHAVVLWRGVSAALSPIVGPAGVAALYQRSIHLTRTGHPGLPSASAPDPAPDEFESLRLALAGLSGTDAAAAATALAYTFHDLLTHLIGDSLTRRLLQSVWISPPSDQAAQDNAS
ncbi:hypothetical protein ATSB10_26600 [Dyella thiooxydans]|uniref:Uncharacterized protein n=1 Tax=Dyella thiooxydans TaxID=445710 RepID=A0A160N375_9GAMM|nr:hypothetical protein [Dyella thiooxydans]AND70114.1 hypothetical protein ATSB10_26600 [Dyella thiooxydans]